jgi:hypothetical protein
MGLQSQSFWQLASSDDDYAHARLPVLQAETWRTSFHECSFAYARGAPAFSRAGR